MTTTLLAATGIAWTHKSSSRNTLRPVTCLVPGMQENSDPMSGTPFPLPSNKCVGSDVFNSLNKIDQP